MKHLILKPRDNTDTGNVVSKVYTKGYSEYNRLYIPNEGIDYSGNIFHYFPYGAIRIDKNIVIDEKHAFLKNGYLLKKGLIVEKYHIKKAISDIFIKDEKFFRVIDSNIESVKKDNLVIVMKDQGHRFNYNHDEYFFIQEDKILIVLNEEGISPGPANMLMELSKKYDILGLNEYKENCGRCNNSTYFFSDSLYEIIISNIKHVVVSKSDIKIVMSDN